MRDTLHGIAYHSLRNEHDAEDAVQDARLNCLRKGIDAHPYLVTATRNRCRDVMRNRARHRMADYDVSDQPADMPTAEDRMIQTEAVDELENHLATLTERQRRIMQLRWYEELTYIQIAEREGATVDAIKAVLHHSMQKLRKSYAIAS